MKNCHPWMLVFCLGVLASLFLLRVFGVNVPGAGVWLVLLMLACCVLPVLAVFPRREGGGCCEPDEPGKSEPGRDGGPKANRSPTCH